MEEIYQKVIKSGDIIEVWEYEKPLKTGKRHKRKELPEKLSNEIKRHYEHYDKHLIKVRYKLEEITFEEAKKELKEARKRMQDALAEAKEQYRIRSLKRTIENATRLINANTDILNKFLTLTFQQDMIDITEANKHFELFIKRLRKHLQRKALKEKNRRRKKEKLKLKDIPLPKFEYVAVIEFQTLNRDYVVHYHVMASFPYIPQKDLQEIWGNGFVWINQIENEKNTGNYILKYMKKSFQKVAEAKGEEFDFEEQLKAKKSMDKLFGRQRILRSEGLKEPIEITKKEEIQKIESQLNDTNFEIGNSYLSEWNGEIKYKRYNLAKKTNIVK